MLCFVYCLLLRSVYGCASDWRRVRRVRSWPGGEGGLGVDSEPVVASTEEGSVSDGSRGWDPSTGVRANTDCVSVDAAGAGTVGGWRMGVVVVSPGRAAPVAVSPVRAELTAGVGRGGVRRTSAAGAGLGRVGGGLGVGRPAARTGRCGVGGRGWGVEGWEDGGSGWVRGV